MADLVHDFTEDAPGLSPSDIAAFCQCCRTIDFEGQVLSDTVMEALTGRFKDLSPDEFANVMWVLALRTDLPMDVEQEIIKALMPHLDELRPEDLAEVLAAVTMLGFRDHALLTGLAEAVQRHALDFQAHDLASLAMTLASRAMTKHFYEDRVFERLADGVLSRLEDFGNDDLRRVVDVYERVSERHANLGPTLEQLRAAAMPVLSPTPQ